MADTTSSRVLGRFKADADIRRLLAHVDGLYEKAARFISRFPAVLREAGKGERAGLEAGEVWQDRFVAYWGDWTEINQALEGAREKLDEVYDSDQVHGGLKDAIGGIVADLRGMTTPHHTRAKFKPEYAAQEVLWRVDPQTGQKHIAYPVRRLTEWAEAFEDWVRAGQERVRAV